MTDSMSMGRYRHYKTNALYDLLYLALDAGEDGDLRPTCVYQPVHDDGVTGCIVWVRPATEFFGEITLPDGIRIDRFQSVPPETAE